MRASVAAPSRVGVLIVEDDDDTRDIVSTFLEAHGFPVVAARNGAEAWSLLRRATVPCVIVLDLMMPVMDGWALRRKLLADPLLASIPVVVISATYDAAQAATALGAVAGLAKPLDLLAFLATIKRYC